MLSLNLAKIRQNECSDDSKPSLLCQGFKNI